MNRLILFFLLLGLFLVQGALMWVCFDKEKEEENEKELCGSWSQCAICRDPVVGCLNRIHA